MHREVAGLTFGDGLHGHHKDHDTLNNQRYNLTPATPSQNRRAAKKHKVKSSIYKGVFRSKRYNGWIALITFEGKQKYLGSSKTEVGAALLYNEAAIKLFGQFALLNEIPQQEAA
jgi:hypothetical protein